MSSYPAFVALVAVAVLVPGPDTMVVLRMSTAAGSRAGVWAAAGSVTGNVVWGVASLAGLTALVAATPAAFAALQLAGAGYLLWLGTRMLLAAAHPGPAAGGTPHGTTGGARSAFARGLACDLGNVKVGMFWLALAPQFLAPGAGALPMAAMVATMGGLTFAWLALCAAAASRMSSGGTIGRALDAAAGLAFCALAAELLLTSA